MVEVLVAALLKRFHFTQLLFPIKETIIFKIKKLINPKFKVVFMEEAAEFLDSLSEKTRNKVYFNIDKSTFINDTEIFKKLEDDNWEFRTLYQQHAIRLFAFWDKEEKSENFSYLNSRTD